ncbi:MAG: NfeD family protein [Muribaculaceae bacterium]|nr:NfeD family protein [Muribaculaceae bacterium]
MGIWSFWLIIAVGFLVAEIFTLSTTCLYIGIGAIAAMCSAWIDENWTTTIIIFVAATILLYLITFRWRRNLNNFLHRGASHTATGMDALIGRTGIVIASPDSLRMKIDGDIWQITSADENTDLSPGTKVRVVGYESIILKVESI